MKHKEKLTYQKMIEWFKNKGIKFEVTTEQEAIEILANEEYFFRISSYRKNFKKIDGKYQDLDFAYLVDLAEIDQKLRYFILEMALDYESAIKVRIMDLITNNYREDGYQIVQNFSMKYPKRINRTLSYFSSNYYLEGLYHKRHDDLAIWTFLEIITFGDLSCFVEFYYDKYQIKSLKSAKKFTRYAKNIRNLVAHNNIFLLNIFEKSEKVVSPEWLVSVANLSNIDKKELRYKKTNDLFSLFYLHNKFCSEKIKNLRKKLGKKLLKQMVDKQWIKNNINLNRFQSFLNKLIDFL